MYDFCKYFFQISGEFLAFSPLCLNPAITTWILQTGAVKVLLQVAHKQSTPAVGCE